MIKRTCPNGHVYDQSITGDVCPLCPPTGQASGNPSNNAAGMTPGGNPGAHTRIVPPPMPGAPQPAAPGGMNGGSAQDPTGNTKVAPNLKQKLQENAAGAQAGARTTIRHNPAVAGSMKAAAPGDRKLVGFLVTYNRTPMGKAFNIYEGRNYVGRDKECDICVPDDTMMSGKHLLIRYLSGNNKFSFKDEMSSNGTYVNKELIDEGELQNYDIIRVGNTLFIFIAIPQI